MGFVNIEGREAKNRSGGKEKFLPEDGCWPYYERLFQKFRA